MAATIEARTVVKFKTWTPPNYAVLALEHQQDSKEVAASIPVSELSEEALADLAMDWLDALYAKADKRNPFQLPPTP